MEVTYWSFLIYFLAFWALESHCQNAIPGIDTIFPESLRLKELPETLPQHIRMQDWSKLDRKLTANHRKNKKFSKIRQDVEPVKEMSFENNLENFRLSN